MTRVSLWKGQAGSMKEGSMVTADRASAELKGGRSSEMSSDFPHNTQRLALHPVAHYFALFQHSSSNPFIHAVQSVFPTL